MSILELNQVSYSYEKKEIRYCLISVIPLKKESSMRSPGDRGQVIMLK